MKNKFDIENDCLIMYLGNEAEVVVPDNVIKINGDAFSYRDNLKSVVIGENVKEICEYAFFDSYNLESIVFPNNIEKIGYSPFEECSKLKYNTFENGKYLGSKDNPYLVFFKALNTEIQECNIHSDAKFIFDYAFSNCINLEQIIIPDNIKSMGENVFLGCKNLRNIVLGKGITCLKKESFLYCFHLENISFSDNLQMIESFAFKNCTRLEKLVLPNSLKCIENCVFNNCENLKSIEIPKDIETIGVNVFLGCKNVELIYYGTENKQIFSDKGVVSIFAPNISLKESKSNRQKFISGYINNFKNNENINFEILKEYVKYIKTNKTRFFESFNENICNFMIKNDILNLDDVDFLIDKTTLNNQVELTANLLNYKNKKFTFEQIEKQLEKSLFCEKKITLSSLKPLWEIKKLDSGNYEILGYKGSESSIEIPSKVSDGIVEKVSLNGKSFGITQKNAKNIKTIIIPETVKFLDDRAFDNCENLSNIRFSSNIIGLGNYAFGFCKKLNFIVYDNAKYLGSIDNPYFILIEAIDKNINSCIINSNTRFIYDSAFQDCWELKEITIPDEVICIGANAFYGCIELEKVVLGRNTSVIKYKAFGDCSKLKSIKIPSGVLELTDYVFSNCSKLENVILPEGLFKIGENCFKDCYNLRKIKIPNLVQKISSSAFLGCDNLEIIK